MRGQPQVELGYKIVPIRLNLSCDWLYDFMTLQLLFLLDTSFDEHVAFDIMALIGGKTS